jgi:hypothetical protein
MRWIRKAIEDKTFQLVNHEATLTNSVLVTGHWGARHILIKQIRGKGSVFVSLEARFARRFFLGLSSYGTEGFLLGFPSLHC